MICKKIKLQVIDHICIFIWPFFILGVENVGGGMFESVPKGDAIFMKAENEATPNPNSFYMLDV